MTKAESFILGIDVGTSAVKVLCIDKAGRTVETIKKLPTETDGGYYSWLDTITDCFMELREMVDLQMVEAISLTCQVNTYILFNSKMSAQDLMVLSWTGAHGSEQLRDIKKKYDEAYFIKTISMPHPDLISYPLPRLQYLRQQFPQAWSNTEKILQPKDYLYYKLTGIIASDPFTWRGLSNIQEQAFSKQVLKDNEIPADFLPDLYSPFSAPGCLTMQMAQALYINKPVPVYLGCNDFFAAVLGMGVIDPGQYFDIGGTSEHVGTITDRIETKPKAISSPFFENFVTYGVTGCSGLSIDWAHKTFSSFYKNPGNIIRDNRDAQKEMPIFLPYLKGERSPVFDSDARGVFFGLNEKHDPGSLIYSVKEGVAFSHYHIWKTLDLNRAENKRPVRIGGLTSKDDQLNQLKADIFQLPFEVVQEEQIGALGTALIGAVGNGWFRDIREAIDAFVEIDRRIEPEPDKNNYLQKRYEIYQDLYPALKDIFKKFNNF
ncbi:MAG: xylulokinase [Planctomycetota bacterium]|jgi:xylulokinase